MVTAYSFDLLANEIATKLVDNPNAGREHVFRAYRVLDDPPDPVALHNSSRLLK